MLEIFVNVAVIENNRLLVAQREDFETWNLPGGGVEDGESVAQAAIRETKEETGLDVELTRLVGIYSRLGQALSGHIVLFTARPVGGEIKCQQGETIAVEWFPFDQIPAPLSIGHKKRIEDALSGRAGSVCVAQEINLPKHPERIDQKELYKLRDRSGLPRQDFYLELIEDMSCKDRTEVGNSDE